MGKNVGKSVPSKHGSLIHMRWNTPLHGGIWYIYDFTIGWTVNFMLNHVYFLLGWLKGFSLKGFCVFLLSLERNYSTTKFISTGVIDPWTWMPELDWKGTVEYNFAPCLLDFIPALSAVPENRTILLSLFNLSLKEVRKKNQHEKFSFEDENKSINSKVVRRGLSGKELVPQSRCCLLLQHKILKFQF